MTHAPVRTTTPEEREYARYLIAIDERKRRAAELQAELETLKLTLARFQTEYHARVGALFVELDGLRLAIDEYERRISQLKASPNVDANTLEREVRDQFASRHEEVRAGQEENRRYEHAHQRERERPQLSANAEDEIKRIYRDLAKRFHPDLARTEHERVERDSVMQRINASFRMRDISTVRSILLEHEFEDLEFEKRSIGEKLVWAIREIARLDGLIDDFMAELMQCHDSETHQLWRRQENEEAVLERLEEDLGTQLTRERDKLGVLIGTYSQLVAQPR